MIKFLDLQAINARFDTAFKNQFQQFLNSGQYILGNGVKQFETAFANYCGTKYCIGVSNGLDALIITFKAYMQLGKLQKGDEVIVPANTFIATLLAITEVGLKPVLVEPDINTFNIDAQEIEKHINAKTKAIVIVHLYGQLANMESINLLAKKNNLLVIEDAAQAHGAINNSKKRAGNLGDCATFSFYPAKNLGALGDAGAITTNNKDFANICSAIRNYGSSEKYIHNYLGSNKRLDELQALFLNEKLKVLDADNEARRDVANRYLNEIKNKKITLPYYNGSKNHVFHLFVILVENRNKFINYMETYGIETAIHYPVAPHKQEAFNTFTPKHLPVTENIHNNCVSLPISPILSSKAITSIITTINNYN
ncbi:DegT/DnrJ/EryC1/StrS aminotransferase family protein [Lacinutrix sp. MedPE-SW]|uniref:DegT/DnrJ/EryC1/StrS family aminotransferase n=1 Tax=Lacinutrix sp. MedPE-SW TaxID=1860087 RepID=UPI00092331B6|nr:DegT/DnrJ/EryC1/StrS family aminotransferase [Lacinutrix sp. MedPE-SW]OIQ17372.1 MAG: aminotransferase [Lacinutrix sp. MedPE-SW]